MVVGIPYVLNAQMPRVNTKFNLHEMSANDLYGAGFSIETNGGEVYRWMHFAQDVGPAKLISPEMNDADVEGWLEEFDDATITGGNVSRDVGNVVAIGHTFLSITKDTIFAAVIEDQFVGCLLGVTDNTGKGYTYPIKGNTAVSGTTVVFELYTPIEIALGTGASDLSICPSNIAKVVIAAYGNDLLPVGVSMADMDVSTADYGWVCTRGRCLCLYDATGTVSIAGDPITLSQNIAGAFMFPAAGHTNIDDLDEAFVGTAIHAGDDAGYAFIMLTNGLD